MKLEILRRCGCGCLVDWLNETVVALRQRKGTRTATHTHAEADHLSFQLTFYHTANLIGCYPLESSISIRLNIHSSNLKQRNHVFSSYLHRGDSQTWTRVFPEITKLLSCWPIKFCEWKIIKIVFILFFVILNHSYTHKQALGMGPICPLCVRTAEITRIPLCEGGGTYSYLSTITNPEILQELVSWLSIH